MFPILSHTLIVSSMEPGLLGEGCSERLCVIAADPTWVNFALKILFVDNKPSIFKFILDLSGEAGM